MEEKFIITRDQILDEDLLNIAESKLPLEQLDNRTVLVTGASGMIGSQLVKALLRCNYVRHTNIRVLALVRSTDKAKSVFEHFLSDERLRLVKGDILSKLSFSETIDYIIHGASVTGSREFVESPVDTIRTAVEGSMNLLELARRNRVKSFVYLSSLEVYGVTDPDLETVKEEDYGYLNPLSVRSSHSESKRMVECLCVAYHKQHGVPVRIARLSQTFGAGVDYEDGRVYAQFARSIIEGKDIVLHTKGDTVRNYCYTRDALKAILCILVKGADGVAYNVANETTACSIRDMAELLMKQYPNSGSRLRFEIEDGQNFGYNPTVKIKLDTTKLQALGWEAEVPLGEMFDRMIISMRSRSI